MRRALYRRDAPAARSRSNVTIDIAGPSVASCATQLEALLGQPRLMGPVHAAGSPKTESVTPKAF